MEKASVKDVKPFAFSELKSSSSVNATGTQAFAYQDFSKGQTAGIEDSVLRKEREAESKSDFRIESVVRESRGIAGQERQDFETSVSKQVKLKLSEQQEKGYSEGLERGRLEGIEVTKQEIMPVFEQQVDQLVALVEGFRAQCEERLEKQKTDIYELIKRITKWVTLKEIKDDGYLPKLLEKMILEMNQRQNLIIKFHPNDFNEAPEALALIEKKLGALSNVRVEPAIDMGERGIILETENGILDASPEALFQTIDKLFESVVSHDE